MARCGTCGNRGIGLRSGGTASLTSITGACKVVNMADGSCALANGDGLCRVFANEAAANAAARAELGEVGWTIQPVVLG